MVYSRREARERGLGGERLDGKAQKEPAGPRMVGGAQDSSSEEAGGAAETETEGQTEGPHREDAPVT